MNKHRSLKANGEIENANVGEIRQDKSGKMFFWRFGWKFKLLEWWLLLEQRMRLWRQMTDFELMKGRFVCWVTMVVTFLQCLKIWSFYHTCPTAYAYSWFLAPLNILGFLPHWIFLVSCPSAYKRLLVPWVETFIKNCGFYRNLVLNL